MDIKIYKIQLEPTNKCNLKCSMCWRTIGNIKNIGQMKFELFKKIVDQLPELKEVDFEGLGEPFLCKDIFKMINYVTQKGINTWSVSNGNLLNRRYCNQILVSGLGKLRLSVDAQDPHLYSKIRGGGSIYRVVQGIKLLNQLKKESPFGMPLLAFNVVILRDNIEDLTNIVHLARSLCVYEISLIPLVIFNGGLAVEEQSFHRNKEIFLENIAKAKETAEMYGIKFDQGISVEKYDELEINSLLSLRPCTEGCYIDWEGNLHPCCNKHYSFGNLTEEKICDIFKSEKYRKFMEYIISNNVSCEKCFYNGE